MAAAPLDAELVGDVVDVVLRVLPVDEMEGEAALIAVDGLLDAFAEREQFVGLLAGGDQAGIDRNVAEFADDGGEIGLAERRRFLPCNGRDYGCAASPEGRFRGGRLATLPPRKARAS